MKIESVIYPTQKELFKKLKVNGCSYKKNAYILVPGELPVMLIAHLDTVHREPVKTICYDKSGNILMSPQGIGGDDRCGVYALLEIYKKSDVKPWVLFTCNEEVGCLGAADFAKDHAAGKLPKGLDDLKFLIEIDRKGKDDAVYYDCDNEEFENYITSKGFKTDFGSCSDISDIAPELGIAAVNLSSGYYNQHTLHEYIVLSELRHTIKRVMSILADVNDLPKYKYIPAPVTYRGYQSSWYKPYGDLYGYTDYKWKDDNYADSIKPAKEKASYTTDPELQREYLLDLGYTDKELDELEEEYGAWAVEETYWDEVGKNWR